jgi:glyoxylase-like metal-dependent hydrolase (beta-lactamase superfamily II)
VRRERGGGAARWAEARDMNVLATGLSWVDLRYRGVPSAIATAVVADAGGVALIDPGPSTALPALEAGLEAQGLRLDEVRWLLLTHIHLDHAGATGRLVARLPRLTVYVHERGAPHVRDPSRLLASAARLYGDRMEELWGEVLPVPKANLVPLSGGERVTAAGRRFEVAATPGHASHHVSYFDRDSGVAFVGDTAGVAVDGGYVMPPTPPPDIDVERWHESVARILAWRPGALFLTHFGVVPAPRPHLHALESHLDAAAGEVRRQLEAGGGDAGRDRFVGWLEAQLRAHGSDPAVYGAAAPLPLYWYGLERYWTTRAA